MTPRDLRRTHGQILAELGVPPHLIGAMLRHSDGRMAERVYSQRSRYTVGRQVAAITRRPNAREEKASETILVDRSLSECQRVLTIAESGDTFG